MKYLALSLCLIVVFILTLIALIPTILSTSWGKNALVGYLNKGSPYELSVEDLDVAWSGPQKLRGVSVNRNAPEMHITIESVEVQSSLFSLIQKPSSVRSVIIQSLNGEIRPATQGTASGPLISLKNVQATIDEQTLHISGETAQGNLVGQFVANAVLKGVSLQDVLQDKGDKERILARFPDAEVQVQADIANFPIVIFDQFLSYRYPELAGIFQEALGDVLNLKIEQVGVAKNLIVHADLTTKTLSAGGEVMITDDLTISRPFIAIMNVQRSVVEKLIHFFSIDAEIVPSDVQCTLSIDQLKIPLKTFTEPIKTADLSPVFIEANVSLNNSGRNFLETSDKIALKQLQVNIAKNINQRLNVRIVSDLAYQNHSFPLELLLGAEKYDSYILGTLKMNSDSFSSSEFIFQIDSIIELQKPATIEVRLPQAFQHLLSKWHIEEISDANVAIHKLELPNALFSKASFNSILRQSSIKASISVPSLKTDQYRLHLNQVVFSIETKAHSIGQATLTATLVQEDQSKALINRFFNEKSSILAKTNFYLYEWQSLKFNGTLEVEGFGNDREIDGASYPKMHRLVADWALSERTRSLSFNFSGDMLIPAQASGKVSGTLVLNHWFDGKNVNFSQATAKMHLTSNHFPVEMITGLVAPYDILPIIGPTMNATIDTEMSLHPTLHGKIEMSVDTPQLQGKTALHLDENGHLRNLDKETSLQLQLSPNGYLAIQRWVNPAINADFHLVNNANLRVMIDDLDLPVTSTMPWGHLGIGGNLYIDHLTGAGLVSKQTIVFDSISCHISTKELSKLVNFRMNAVGKNPNHYSSSWDIDGSLANSLTSNGHFNEAGLSLNLDGTMTNLSVPMLSHLLFNPKLGRQLQAVLGSNVNAKFNAALQSMNGPIALSLNGDNGQFQLDAQINNGILTLRRDLEAQLKITPELGLYVLQDLIPTLKGILRSDQHLMLNIKKQGFAVPVKNPNLTNISLAQGSLSLGKVYFTPQSQMAKVLSLLTPGYLDEVLVWSTPAFFSINDGIVKLERVDLLINDHYHTAAWGYVDVGKDRVHMTIGLSGEAISKAFNIAPIESGFMLQLPLRGTLDNATIDKTKAAARLSAIIAQNQGGPEGMVLGTVLHIASGGMNEPKIPPPTTYPFPWPEEKMEKNEKGNQSPETHPIKQLQKGASSIIKKIFK